MSESDRYLLEQIVKQEHEQNAPRSPISKYFEIFSAEQVTKDLGFDLDPEQVRSGVIGIGGGDGGVDSIYIFANRVLVREDADLSQFTGQHLAIDLVIIQSKYKNSFSESTIQRLCDFTENCLKLNADMVEARRLYNQPLVEAVERFHNLYRASLTQRPSLTITYIYASIGDQVAPQVEARREMLRKQCKGHFSAATVNFDFIGAPALLRFYNRTPTKTLKLRTSKSLGLSSFGTAYICLTPLQAFYDFITDRGTLRGHIFEANVRDYQGNVSVNTQIRATLAVVGSEEFWWLNNGITVLASEARLDGEIMSLTDPLIVNGLQTSYEVYHHFQKSDGDDPRTILVRVIQTGSTESVDNIIQATNSQTQIPRIWLHATEAIHRKIEIALRSVDLYYDRRKNHYRNQGISSSKIITIPYLAQAVAAVALQRPEGARARPTTVADQHYRQMFSEFFPIEMYQKCALLLKRVDDYLDGIEDIDRGTKSNVMFHVAMHVSCVMLNSHHPQRQRIAALELSMASDNLLAESCKIVRAEYERLGGNDRTAKGPTLTESLKESLKEKFARPVRSKVEASR